MKLEIQPFLNVRCDKAQALKPLEEAAEVYAAWQEYDRRGTVESRIDMWDECMDVMQAIVNLMYADGFGAFEVDRAIERCRRRNVSRGREYAEWG